MPIFWASTLVVVMIASIAHLSKITPKNKAAWSALGLLLLSTLIVFISSGIFSLQEKSLDCLSLNANLSHTPIFLSRTISQIQGSVFSLITGVCPRQKVNLLENATFENDELGSNFVLSNGVMVPPLDFSSFQKIREALPKDKRHVLDEKFFWLLQTNPALPLIAAGLENGEYSKLVNNDGVFDTNTYYKDKLFRKLFDSAQIANIEIEELIPLLEIHFTTLSAAYFENSQETEGVIDSFNRNEIELTDKQYLFRYLIQTPLESLVRVFAISYVEKVKAEYTLSPETSTTISLGRLPLPTPTAAEDTPSAHALAIANAMGKGIHLFPISVEISASQYKNKYQETFEIQQELTTKIRILSEQHGTEIIDALNNFKDHDFWQNIGITRHLGLDSIHQLDTSKMLGIYATRHEGLTPGLRAYKSYQKARLNIIRYYQDNDLGLSKSELLSLLFNDQAFNQKLWITLKRKIPALKANFREIGDLSLSLEKHYRDTSAYEAAFFYELQKNNLDISTDAFVLLSVAMARRFSDLAYIAFKPIDRKNSEYLSFIRFIFPFQRDMPDMNVQWGDGRTIKRYGLENYLVPDLLALHPRDAPMLSGIERLHNAMVKGGDLEQWDFETLVKLISTACNLSVGKNPSTLANEQIGLLPLVAKYRSELKQISGADGLVGTSILHGLGLQDYRIASWPKGRQPFEATNIDDVANILSKISSRLSEKKQYELAQILTRGSSEPSLSLKLVLQHDPKFILQKDGRLDLTLTFEQNGLWKLCTWDFCRLRIRDINQEFETIFSPMYMARILLPNPASESDAEALNQVIAKSHAIYGGFTPRELSLPGPLQAILSSND